MENRMCFGGYRGTLIYLLLGLKRCECIKFLSSRSRQCTKAVDKYLITVRR